MTAALVPSNPRLGRRIIYALFKDGKQTTLQPGDRICWCSNRLSVSFGRNGQDGNCLWFADPDGTGKEDDRHPLRVSDWDQFRSLTDLIAALHGFDVEVHSGTLISFVAKRADQSTS